MAGGNSVDIKALETALGQVTSTFRSLSDKMDASTNVLDAIKDILGDTNANIAKNTSGKSTAAKKKSTASGQQMSKTSASSKPIIDNLLSTNRSISVLDKTLGNVVRELQRFNQNIQGGAQSSAASNNSPKNANVSGGQFSNVKEILNDIKEEIAKFHEDFVSNLASTGNEKLDGQIQRQNQREAREKLEYRKALYNYKHGKASENDLKKLKEHRKQEKRLGKLNGGVSTGAAVASAITKGFGAIMKGGMNASSLIDSGIGALTKISPWFALLNIGKSIADTFDKEQGYGRDYARSYGGGKAGRDQFMDISSRFRRHMPLSSGYTAEEFYKASAKMTDDTGRQMYRTTEENMKSAIDLSRMGIDGVTEMFDTFGQSLKSTDEYFTKLYQRSGQSGLSFKKMTDAVKSNLKMAQTYTFSKGVNGLQKMAETSTRLKYNMSEVARFAEKVNTVEGAIKASASLSVLGGDFAQFSNPMGLLYEGLNDMEGLNDRMVKMFSDMAYFDRGKGQIEIGAYDKQRIRAAAEAMGVDANEMMNIAMNSRREGIAETQAKRSGIYDKDLLGYIKNLAQLDKEGNAYISGQNGEKVYLNEKDKIEALTATLKKESEAKTAKEAAGVGDVYAQTRSIYDFLNDNLAGVSSKLQALVTRFIHGDSMNAAQRETWREIKNDPERFAELKDKYGGRRQLRRAIRNEQFDAEIARDKFGGDIDRMNYYNKNVSSYLANNGHWNGGIGPTGGWVQDKTGKDFREEINSGNWDEKIRNGEKAYHTGLSVNNMNEHTATILRGESVLNRRATDLLGHNNIRVLNSGQNPYDTALYKFKNRTAADYLNTISVSPSFAQRFSQSQQGQQKIAFEPITLTINGQFNVNSGNQFRNIPIDDIDTRALKKAILDTVTENIPTIMRKANILNDRGYDMEHDKFRGAIQGSYV